MLVGSEKFIHRLPKLANFVRSIFSALPPLVSEKELETEVSRPTLIDQKTLNRVRLDLSRTMDFQVDDETATNFAAWNAVAERILKRGGYDQAIG